MKHQDMKIDDYIPDYYLKEKYEACYSPMIYPANGQNLWTKTEFNDLQPPLIKRQPGRPKKKRNKDADEKKDDIQLKRARYGSVCSRCKQKGHNKSTCKLPPPPPPSQNGNGNQAATNVSHNASVTASNSISANATSANVQAATTATSTQAASSTQAIKAAKSKKRQVTTKAPKVASSTQPPPTKLKRKTISLRSLRKDGGPSTQPN